MKIGLLIPCTSKGRDWKSMRETYLFNYTIKTFIETLTYGHEYVIYVGYDADDAIFSKKEEQNYLRIVERYYKHVSFRFIELHEPAGYLTKIWNRLFRQAYDEGCDYFFQCGDDIFFRTNGWIQDCIDTLLEHDNVGLTGPDNLNGRILTQSFVSRKHMDIFGKYFPESIINWGCDDWYNWVYEGYLYKLSGHICTNEGGQPRYIINYDEHFEDDIQKSLFYLRKKVMKRAIKDREKIKKYLNI